MRSSAACGTGNLTVSAGSSHPGSVLLTVRHSSGGSLPGPPPRSAGQSGCRNAGLQGVRSFPGSVRWQLIPH
jgi:hypothetical protein